MEASAQRLDTSRVTLLPWDSLDWLAIKPIAQDPRVMKYISAGVPWTDEQIIGFVDRQRLHFAMLGYCLWKLVVKRIRHSRSSADCSPLKIWMALRLAGGWGLGTGERGLPQRRSCRNERRL